MVEATLQVANCLDVGAGVEGVAGQVHVRMFHDRQEAVAAVEGGDDGGIAKCGVAAGHVLHVLLVAMDAVDEEQSGVRAAHRRPGDVGGHRVAVVAGDSDVVGSYVGRMVDQSRGHCTGNQ